MVIATEELFLICSRIEQNEDLINRARDLIKEGIDADLFTKRVTKSAMPLIFYNSLKRLGYPGSIRREFIDNLKAAHLCAVSIASSQYKETLEIVKLFSRHGIIAAPLKGTVLSKRLYGDVATRGISSDIDLFVKWEDRKRVHDVLTAGGYRIVFSKDGEKRYWQEAWRKEGASCVDIIYDLWLGGYNKKAITGLWDGTRRVTDESGEAYYELKEEELLIYLAAHLMTASDWHNLKYLCDINECLGRYGGNLNWDSVIDKAKRWRLSASLYTALALNRDLFGRGAPQYVTDKLRPPLLPRIVARTFYNGKAAIRDDIRKAFLADLLNYKLFALIEARSPRDYLLFFKVALFPPQEVMLGRSHLSRILKRLSKTLHSFRGYNKSCRIKRPL